VRLLLVRHGESNAAVNGIVGGERGCTGLTERGFAQARALGDRLRREGFVPDVVLASTLPRAFETAETLAEGFGMSVERHDDLCEFRPGEIDGTRWEDYESFDIVAEPDRVVSPGGESLNVFHGRVRSMLDQLAAAYDGKTVLAATHGGFIATSIINTFGIGTERSVWVDVEFTSITEWRLDNETWHLARANDYAHLAGSDLLASV
jgi:probable phosphoglycerate mutase